MGYLIVTIFRIAGGLFAPEDDEQCGYMRLNITNTSQTWKA
ncbi:MAG: hypothetical protein RBU28_08165 [Bacteroidales bacterium]|nr:hypothetical protein [Bacteroidales bacterium]